MTSRSHIAVLGASAFALAATALSPTTTASATPDDTARTSHEGRIVATAYGPGYIVSMLPDGTDRQRIVAFPDKDGDVRAIDVTDDGSQVAMSFSPGRPRGSIYTVNSDGSDLTKVSSGGDIGLTYSPNGARIAFIRGPYGEQSLMRMNADGSAVTELTSGAEPQPADWFASWSPDGEYIAFVWRGKNQTAIVLTNPRGTWFRFVRTFSRERADIYNLNWSPDSKQIIFEKYRGRNFDLWTVNKAGTSITRITDTPKVWEVSPAYSPDGTQIASSVRPRSGAWADVLVMDADGSNRNRIETDAREYHVAWGGTPP